MTLASTQSLGVTIAVDFVIQFVFYVVSALLKTERFYDGSGALTYIACVLVGLLLREDSGGKNSLADLAPRQIIAAAAVLVWCLRLGIFLFLRVQKTADHRFDELKENPVKFAIPWFFQVVWIFLTALPVYFVLGNVAGDQAPLQWSDGVGIAVWVIGFAIESIADAQKQSFKNANPSKFMQSGLFKYSRYPNYFGEVTLWVGMFILCAAGFSDSWQWVSIVSPVFVFCLIYFVSGVRLLEISSEKRYGADPEFIAYKRRTSKFVLWFPKSGVVATSSLSGNGGAVGSPVSGEPLATA